MKGKVTKERIINQSLALFNKFASVSPYPNWVFDKESLEWRSPIPESKNACTFNVESEKYKSINEIPRVHIPKIEELS
jgi:hypothetical protein